MVKKKNGEIEINADLDAFNLADKLIAIFRGEADDDVLGRYERQRRHVAIQPQSGRHHPQQAPAGREGTRGSPGRTTTSCAGLRKTPKLARAFLLRSSLIESIREAELIPVTEIVTPS